LREAIATAPGEDARALVISGGPTVFSAGLDVPRLLTMQRVELEAAWREFFGVLEALARSPLPSVAAIGGHSPAGGAVIGLFCDYRVMARGPFRIGLNEVQVGLIVPECIQHALRRLVGTYRAERLLVSGAMIEAEQALAIGMVDELVDVDHVTVRALAWLEELLKLPGKAMHATRSLARADLVEAIADPSRLDLPRFLDEWFSEETQAVLGAMVARLRAKG
jgi:3,2-trans-enoyl-CoA isomerase